MITTLTAEIKMRCVEEAKCGNRANKGKCFSPWVQKAFCTRSCVSVMNLQTKFLFFFLSRDY